MSDKSPAREVDITLRQLTLAAVEKLGLSVHEAERELLPLLQRAFNLGLAYRLREKQHE